MPDTLEDKLKQQAQNAKRAIETFKKIDFQVDTLANVPDDRYLAGYFTPYTKTITINYPEQYPEAQKLLSTERSLYLQHEEQHRINNKKGISVYDIKISPDQFFKLCAADEISANMAELIYLREEYIKTKDLSLFDKDEKKFEFYKEAVQRGNINPLSSDPKDFNKDMSLIMNGTQKMWLTKYLPNYQQQLRTQTSAYIISNDRQIFAKDDSTFQALMDKTYTLGGVNFNKYNEQNLLENNPIIITEPQRLFRQENLEKTLDGDGKEDWGDVARLMITTSQNEDITDEKSLKNYLKEKNSKGAEYNNYLKNYPLWENETKRTSKILYTNVLDMEKNIIKKPQQSSAESQKNSSSQKSLARLRELRGLTSPDDKTPSSSKPRLLMLETPAVDDKKAAYSQKISLNPFLTKKIADLRELRGFR